MTQTMVFYEKFLSLQMMQTMYI